MARPATKYDDLLHLLAGYNKIAVAYSGGVDSTFLVHSAVAVLGADRVQPYYLLSSLNSSESVQLSRKIFADNFPSGPKLQEIEAVPLDWQEFVVNDLERCYFCKKGMYTAMKSAAACCDISVLADGTNVDDLREHRPGLRAIRELDVKTPLVAAGLSKADIRRLAQDRGLTNFNLPANSCLATRIPHHRKIDEKILDLVEQAEGFLHRLGFCGCRVRMLERFTLVEVLNKDLHVIVEHSVRGQIQHHFMALGLGPVMLSLQGR